MGYESMLADIKSSLNGKISDVEDKIEKLKKAKKDIDTLQEEAITEIKEIVKPELGKHWTEQKPMISTREEKRRNRKHLRL